jgi:hypothetical protein
MIRRILKVLTVAVVVLLLLGIGVWFLLQPPVLAVPSQERLVFANVTVVNPGLSRHTGQTLTIQNGQIATIAAEPLPRWPISSPMRWKWIRHARRRSRSGAMMFSSSTFMLPVVAFQCVRVATYEPTQSPQQ